MIENSMPEFVAVCQVHDVPEGSARMFVVDDVPIGIFNVNGEFFAIDNRCPHAGASLSLGFIDHDQVTCRIHHYRFCVRDGKYLDHEQPELNARTFSLRVVGQEVQVAIDGAS